MKRNRAVVIPFTLAAVLALRGAEPGGFVHWKAGDLRAFESKLAAKLNAQKMASEQLGKFGNHSFMVAHREGNGEAELHETQADIFVVQTGEATLVVGGSMPGSRTTAPGELRSPRIEGGERRKLGPGDMVHIPAKIPHQLLVDAGKQFTYAVVKIDVQ